MSGRCRLQETSTKGCLLKTAETSEKDERSDQRLKSGRMSRHMSMKRVGNSENMGKNPQNDARPVQQATDTKLQKFSTFKKTPYPG